MNMKESHIARNSTCKLQIHFYMLLIRDDKGDLLLS